jgi:hypothetical protein
VRQHVDHPVLQYLKPPDRTAKLRAITGVFHRQRERPVEYSERLPAERDGAGIDNRGKHFGGVTTEALPIAEPDAGAGQVRGALPVDSRAGLKQETSARRRHCEERIGNPVVAR